MSKIKVVFFWDTVYLVTLHFRSGWRCVTLGNYSVKMKPLVKELLLLAM